MPSGVFKNAPLEAGTLATGIYKLMLMGTNGTTFVFDPDLEFVDNGANNSTDPSFCETNTDGYAAGFSGAGRFTATITVSYDAAGNKQIWKAADQTWTALGASTADTIHACIIWKPVTNDADSLLIAYIDVANKTTDGSNVDVLFDQTNGILDALVG